MKFLRDEAGQIDKGNLSTQIITYGMIIVTAIFIYLTQNPSILNDALGPVLGGLVLFVLSSVIFNLRNPRPTEPENPIIEEEA